MKKVVVGMSGGVDSSVAAAILKEEGYDVVGLFMRNWDSSVNNEHLGVKLAEDDICPQEKDYLDAKKSCEILKIPLHRINFVEEYWNYVFEYFLTEIKRGRTPNPDLMCNKFIKFDAFIREAKKLGADLIAFGHYAKITHHPNLLYRAVDKNKDQTYFLAMVNQEQLSDVIFPLGDLKKEEVRLLAEKYHLNNASKKDSTGICFIGERNFPIFLQNYFQPQKGKVIDIDKQEVIGEHQGLINYTIGQRKGLNIGGYSSALYVVAKDLKANCLYVSSDEKSPHLLSNRCFLTDLNIFINLEEEKVYQAKFRYRQKDNIVSIRKHMNKVEVLYNDYVSAVTPGQACVIYDNDVCVAAGIIESVYNNDNKLVYIGGTNDEPSFITD